MGFRRLLGSVLKSLWLLPAAIAIIGFISVYASGGKLLSVQSGSMAPYIRQGDLVSVMPIDSSEIRVGDVVTFINPADANTTVTHRVVSLPSDNLARNSIITKGDAHIYDDVPIDASYVIGRVNLTLPYLGYGVDVLRTWPGLILIIYLPALFIAAIELKRVAAYFHNQHSYVLAGYDSNHQVAMGQKLFTGVKLGLFLIMLLAAVAIPTQAVL